jgi:O-methyltransferase involved in polyketide biosynthesis
MNFVARGCMYCEGECNKECLKEAAEKLKGRELFKESNDRARKLLSEVKSLPIVETLEEAAKIIFPHKPFVKVDITNKKREAFIEGYKLAQQRMYSEEDLRTAWIAAKNSSDFNKWFEQFKK